MKHVKYILCQNTYTVKLIETNFYKHNRVHFQFLLQKRDFSRAWEVPWVSQVWVLMEQEDSPY